MNISQRLRACAKHTGLDAVIELLQEAADEIDALQARAILTQQPATGEPVVVQHRKPVEGWSGETIGYTAWRDGKGLDWWPHRELYDRPAPSVPDDMVRDAERGRFLVGWLKRFGLLQTEFGQIGAGEKPENRWLLHAPWGIDQTRPSFGHGKTPEQAIDAAMLAAK